MGYIPVIRSRTLRLVSCPQQCRAYHPKYAALVFAFDQVQLRGPDAIHSRLALYVSPSYDCNTLEMCKPLINFQTWCVATFRSVCSFGIMLEFFHLSNRAISRVEKLGHNNRWDDRDRSKGVWEMHCRPLLSGNYGQAYILKSISCWYYGAD